MRDDYRHEVKHEINYSDMLDIRRRLSAIARRDEHAKERKYHIRSLYFDTPEDTALREKLLGVAKREKYRIRCYDGDTSFFRLLKKIRMTPFFSDKVPKYIISSKNFQGWKRKRGENL